MPSKKTGQRFSHIVIGAHSSTGDVIRVQTRNTQYRLEVSDPHQNKVLIKGGKYWPQESEVMIQWGLLEVGRIMIATDSEADLTIFSSTISSIVFD